MIIITVNRDMLQVDLVLNICAFKRNYIRKSSWNSNRVLCFRVGIFLIAIEMISLCFSGKKLLRYQQKLKVGPKGTFGELSQCRIISMYLLHFCLNLCYISIILLLRQRRFNTFYFFLNARTHIRKIKKSALQKSQFN